MRFSLVHKVLGAAVLIVAGFFIAQAMRMPLDATQQSRTPAIVDDATSRQALAADRLKPRFDGTIDGITLSPIGSSTPKSNNELQARCGDLPTELVSWDHAGDLAFDLALPKEYVPETEIGTGVIACGDTTLSVNRAYRYAGSDGAEVFISRSVSDGREWVYDVSVDRPKVQMVGGRDVVMVAPITKSGRGEHAYAFFPEPFGVTLVHGVDMPQTAFNELVAIVASSTNH